MPKQVASPVVGQAKKFPLRLPDELAADLYLFCEVTGAFHTKVICKAVRRYIDEELHANDGIRSDFAREKTQWVSKMTDESEMNVLRLVSKADDSGDPSNRGARASKRKRMKKD